ncbi:MAG: hypothetical protein R6V44_07740 [Paracoccaceae bacterium]
MRRKFPAAAVVAAAAFTAAAPAPAAEVAFRFASVVGGNGTTIPGTSPGDAVEIVVIADNGGASLADATWLAEHHLRTEVSVGGDFSLIQSGSLEFAARTAADGTVAAIDLFKSPGLAVGSDGEGGGMALTVNGARNIVLDGVDALDAEALTTPENWTVEFR